jgi:Glycosyl hydrolase family 1
LRDDTSQIDSAALGPLSSTAVEVPIRSADDEPYPRAFMDGFVWGIATAAVQVKDAWNEDGKGEPNWNRLRTLRRTARPGHVAADHYYQRGGGRSACQSFSAQEPTLSFLYRLAPPLNVDDGLLAQEKLDRQTHAQRLRQDVPGGIAKM